MNLNPAQEAAVAETARLDLRWREAKQSAAARAKVLVEQELKEIRDQRDQAAYRALQLGVPKMQLGKNGLHTSSPVTVADIVARFEPAAPLIPLPIVASTEPPAETAPLVGSVPEPEIERIPGPVGFPQLRLALAHFPTLSKREGFPEILRGVVIRDTEARSGWAVVDDPTDEPTEFGPIPGYLRDEIERNWFPEDEPEGSHLPTVLSKWAAENA